MKLWKFLPPQLAHELAPWGLAFYSSFLKSPPPTVSFQWRGLRFPRRVGVAGGVDKNATQILDWQNVGAGFVEVGTVTPEPQRANPGKILARDWQEKILWNKMGFPNDGAHEVYYNLLHAQSDLQIPVFVNIGKNRHTSNENALQDYKFLAQIFAPHCSALTLNVSSPNTAGLRELQTANYLTDLVGETARAASQTPVLVKLSPDQSEEQLETALTAALDGGASGFVLTNTTISRTDGAKFPPAGGLSGQAVAPLAKKALRKALQFLGTRRENLLIVSVGGVLTSEDVNERLEIGADLVQVYSALVFEGPSFFRKVLQP